MKKHIEIIARGVFVESGKILLCRNREAMNVYLPGGHIESGESAKVALIREIKEEMGRVATVGRFLGGAENSFIQNGKRHSEINLIFEMTVKNLIAGKKPSSCEDYIEFIWVPLAKLKDSGMKPGFLCRIIPSWLDSSVCLQRWATNME
ncbi:MAG: hypothetical protein A2283_01440 [Lentisphaerae bacterium RIFOXYA12_FULL_48_11]|nr:MAG: hypothetical protein A2283_01440 [Lentisphaerae bacterium RIFOXYA12_FULL_48_11]